MSLLGASRLLPLSKRICHFLNNERQHVPCVQEVKEEQLTGSLTMCGRLRYSLDIGDQVGGERRTLEAEEFHILLRRGRKGESSA